MEMGLGGSEVKKATGYVAIKDGFDGSKSERRGLGDRRGHMSLVIGSDEGAEQGI